MDADELNIVTHDTVDDTIRASHELPEHDPAKLRNDSAGLGIRFQLLDGCENANDECGGGGR